MTARPILAVTLLAVAALPGCAATPPLHVNITGNEVRCAVRIGGALATNDDELSAVAKPWRGRHAVVQVERESVYRCVGGTIFTLQRAGILIDDVTSGDGISIYEK